MSPEYFGDFGDSVFRIMTGEAWSEVARSVMSQRPLAWIFFVGYIVITTFTVLNLFIAVAVSAMEAQVSKETKEREQRHADDMATVLSELRALRAAVDRLEQPVHQ